MLPYTYSQLSDIKIKESNSSYKKIKHLDIKLGKDVNISMKKKLKTYKQRKRHGRFRKKNQYHYNIHTNQKIVSELMQTLSTNKISRRSGRKKKKTKTKI